MTAVSRHEVTGRIVTMESQNIKPAWRIQTNTDVTRVTITIMTIK